MEFWRIYRVVRARRWMILALMLVALLTVWAAKHVADEQKEYGAVAYVQPSPAAMNPLGLPQDKNGGGVMGRTYDRFTRLSLFIQSITGQQDEALALASRSPIEQKEAVIRALLGSNYPKYQKQVHDDPAGRAKLADQVLTNYHVPTDPQIWTARTVTPEMRDQIREGLNPAPYYSKTVDQTPGGTSPTATMLDLILVPVHASNPQFAIQVANLTAASFINDYHDSGTQDYQNAVVQAQAKQKQAKAALDKATDAVENFKKRTGIFDLTAFATGQATNLQTLKDSQNRAQVALASARQSIAQLQSQLSATKPTITTNLDPNSRPEVQQAAAKLNQEQAALQTLEQQYTPENFKIKQAQAQLQADTAAYQRLLKEPYVTSHENPRYTQLQADLGTQRTQAAGLAATVSQQAQQIRAMEASNSSTLPEAEKNINKLKNDQAQAESNWKAAQQSYVNLIASNKALKNGLIQFNQPAQEAPPDTMGPGLISLLIYAALLSLVIGIGLALGLDYLDNRIQTVGDAQKLLGMPISAVIPALPATDPKSATRLLLTDPLSPGAEAYRLLRTDLLFTAEDKPFKSLMCATAKPGQGATTTICNLAVALAQVGKNVILIDADLRRPHLHDYFGVSNDKGLTSLLQGDCEMGEALKHTDIDKLVLLPSGPLPLNPAELLASPQMRSLHERLKPHTDFILIDTPSAIAFSDSAILASFMDAVLLVMRAQEAPRGGESRVKELLSKARANVVGVVLNGVKPELVDSAYYHSAYYPQITTTLPNAGALPPPVENAPLGLNAPANGQPLRDGYEQTLMGVRINHSHLHLSPPDAPHESNGHASVAEAVAVNPDGLAESTTQVKRPDKDKPQKGRFSLRSIFGTDEPGER